MLAGQGLAFNFSLSVGSTFSFSLEARGKGQALVTQGKTKKKKTPSTLRRNARRRTEFLKKKLKDSPGNEDGSAKETVKKEVECGSLKCEQCENFFKSKNDLKIQAGKAQKRSEINSTNAPEVEAVAGGLGEPLCLPLLDASREELSLPQSLPSPPSPPSPHKCPVFPQEPCRRQKCRLRIEREKEKEALGKTCTHCDVDLYITMCCAEEKGLCHDCCDDLGVCSS